MANLLNMLRDAVVNTLSLFVGRLGGKGGMGGALHSQSDQIKELGGTVLGLVANAYEPLLERYLGKRVVLDLAFAEGAPQTDGEFSGYLVEYNEKFIALFNPTHESEEAVDAVIEETTELSGCKVEISEEHLAVVCTGKDAIVVKQMEIDDEVMDVGAVLLAGQRLSFHRAGASRVRLVAERTRHLDIICPRSRASVRFSSTGRGRWPRRLDRCRARRGGLRGALAEATPSGLSPAVGLADNAVRLAQTLAARARSDARNEFNCLRPCGS